MSYASMIFLTLLLIVLATGIIVLVLIYQKRQLLYLSEREQMKGRFEREILESKLEMQEQTLRHISQELHDNIGQVLSVVKLNLTMMNCPDSILQEKIVDTSNLVGKTIHDLRDLSKSFHSDIISERGLVKAIEQQCMLLNKTGAYTTVLHITGEPYPLPEQKELILFRIFQEALNNTIKHAGASQIETTVDFKTDQFALHINDNGKGFDNKILNTNNSLGLRNIMNRSDLIGAYYHIDSREGSGTSVSIKLPIRELAAK